MPYAVDFKAQQCGSKDLWIIVCNSIVGLIFCGSTSSSIRECLRRMRLNFAHILVWFSCKVSLIVSSCKCLVVSAQVMVTCTCLRSAYVWVFATSFGMLSHIIIHKKVLMFMVEVEVGVEVSVYYHLTNWFTSSFITVTSRKSLAFVTLWSEPCRFTVSVRKRSGREERMNAILVRLMAKAYWEATWSYHSVYLPLFTVTLSFMLALTISACS